MIILTGGAGFIGSCLLSELNNNNYNDILIVDNLGTGNKWKNLANKKFTSFIHKDDFLQQLDSLYDIEAIFHLGACSSTTEQDANYLMRNNYLYSAKLASYAVKNNIRFIYASSAATYGNGEKHYSDASINDLIPLNCYGLSKHLFDMWVDNNKLWNKVTGIKFFNVFGPNERHKKNMQSIIPQAFNQIKKTGKIQLFKSEKDEYKDGEQKRDFIYVKDCTKIMIKMLTDKNFTGLYNLGTGKSETWNDIANAVFNAMNLKPNIEYINMPENISKQYQYFTQADTTKIIDKLGDNWQWTSLKNAVMDYVCNYLQKDEYL